MKCVFIDPPYNTGSAFTHYDDGLEHSIWLGLMRDRLEIIRRLLADDGSLWITIDDNEAHYLKVSSRKPSSAFRFLPEQAQPPREPNPSPLISTRMEPFFSTRPPSARPMTSFSWISGKD